MATVLRLISCSRSEEATMFWTSILGSMVILTSAFSRSLATLLMATLTSSRHLAPVQTTFPLLKIRVAVLGSLSL